MTENLAVKRVMIHGLAVKVTWHSDGHVIYSCPWHGCQFQTSFPGEAEDVECRLDAYVEMHDHLKAHILKKIP